MSEDITYPTQNEADYDSWVAPEHECTFIEDNTVEAGVMDDGVLRIYQIKVCTQCSQTTSIRTDRIATPPTR